MTNIISIVVSVLALIVSSITAWLTLIRRGHILMTQPTIIYFGPDRNSKTPDKVFFRTLLYATGKRGHVLENMFVRLRCGESQQNFNIWVYGDAELRRGSGLFIPETGLATNHHFLLPPDGTSFPFLPGMYDLEVFASEVGCKAESIFSVSGLEITPDLYERFRQPAHGLYFDWGPDSQRYFAHVRPPPAVALPLFLREMFAEDESAAPGSS